jgi:hemolysin activation/secretion protein
VETKTFKLNSDINFDMITSTTNVNNTSGVSSVFNRYNSRAIRTGLNAIKDDSHGRWVSRFEVSTGIPIFGGTKEGLPFVKINPSLVRVQMLPYKTKGLLRVAGQFSPNKLQPVEQIQIGGMNSVRGFEEGLNFGDKGYFLSLELRKTIPYLPDYKFLKLKDRVALAAFYDHGFSGIKGVPMGYHRFLQSVGFGFRYDINKYLHANFDFGIPLGRERTGDQKGMRFHFNVSSGII